MQNPEVLAKNVTRFLDRMIEEHGVLLYFVAVYVGLGIIIWIIARPRKRPVHYVNVVILPLEHSSTRNADRHPPPLLDQPPLRNQRHDGNDFPNN